MRTTNIELVFPRLQNLVHIFWIFLLQIPLLKIQRIQNSENPGTNTTPTTIELCLATFVFWTLQFSFESTGTVLLTGLFGTTPVPALTEWKALATNAILGMLVKPFIATWSFHIAVLTLLDFIFPSLCALYFYPSSTIGYTLARSRNLIAFLHELMSTSFTASSKQPAKRPAPKHQRNKSKSLNGITSAANQTNGTRLERSHSQTQLSGQRTLDWNLVIDSLAMNEMKETLGPPGGFGELGFCVHKDGVKFECMGPGTSFSLTFKLDGEEEKANWNGNSSSSSKPRKKKR